MKGVTVGPSVDILLASYNGGCYLDAQVESIRSQTYGHWRLLASDDCSEDDSRELIRSHARADPRIVDATSGERYGSAKSHFMRLLRLVDAEYAMFCDQDDVWLPNKISVLLNAAMEAEAEFGKDSPVLVFSDVSVVDDALNVLDPSFMHYSHIDPHNTSLERLLAQNSVNGCATLMNRALVELINRTPDGAFVRMHDRWAALVAAALGHIVFVDSTTVLYRQHGSNSVGASKFGLGALQSYSHYVRSVEDSMTAARTLDSVYGDLLSDSIGQIVRAYGGLGEVPRLMRGVSLIRYKTLKAGFLRSVGQVAVTVLLPRARVNGNSS